MRLFIPGPIDVPGEILRELAFARMVQRGLDDSQARRTITNEEMGRRIKTWRK